jgi:hypothetical protein
MQKKRRSTHAEGEYDFEYYIASEGVMASHVFCGKMDSLSLYFFFDVIFLLATQICC